MTEDEHLRYLAKDICEKTKEAINTLSINLGRLESLSTELSSADNLVCSLRNYCEDYWQKYNVSKERSDELWSENQRLKNEMKRLKAKMEAQTYYYKHKKEVDGNQPRKETP